MMEEIILKYIREQFCENVINKHFSYCNFPEVECECRRIDTIEFDTPLISSGYIDSFSMVSVLVFLENTFNVHIPDVDAVPYNFDSVRRMCHIVIKNKARGSR